MFFIVLKDSRIPVSITTFFQCLIFVNQVIYRNCVSTLNLGLLFEFLPVFESSKHWYQQIYALLFRLLYI